MKKIILLASFIFSLNAFGQTPSYLPTNGLVGWWPFNGNANDESGNGNDCISLQLQFGKNRFGTLNQSAFFNGDTLSSLTAVVPYNKSLTYCFWMKQMTPLNNYPVPFYFHKDGNYNISNYLLYTNSSALVTGYSSFFLRLGTTLTSLYN